MLRVPPFCPEYSCVPRVWDKMQHSLFELAELPHIVPNLRRFTFSYLAFDFNTDTLPRLLETIRLLMDGALKNIEDVRVVENTDP